jgi:hypothetical protein
VLVTTTVKVRRLPKAAKILALKAEAHPFHARS